MSHLIVLNETEVRLLYPMAEAITVMEETFLMMARGLVQNPLRSLFRPEHAKGFLGLMPSWLGGEESFFGLKEVCVFPGNPARGLDTHLGAVLLHSGDTGELLAVINAAAVTAIRTAAVSAVATRMLARKDSMRLAIIGTGAQARAHLQSHREVMSLSRVMLAGRSRQHAEEFAFWARRTTGLAVELCNAEEAVSSADVVVTATSSKDPVIRREWVQPGTHINLVGSSVKTSREADSATVAEARLFVDRRESTENESGDYLEPLREGRISSDHIRAELGEVLSGQAPGREREEDITIFKSLGLAIEDLTSAIHLYRRAQETGGGTRVEFG